MKIIHYILLLTIISLAGFGCENVNVLDTKLVYKEYVVVRADLKADQEFAGVSITKTLPTNELYDTAKAQLTGVSAYLIVNGMQVVPLLYTSGGIYKPFYRFIVVPGYTYELFAEYNGKQIYAKTKVPIKPTIMSASLMNSYIDVYVKQIPGEAYGSIWELSGSPSAGFTDRAKDFLSVIAANQDTLSPAVVRTMDIPSQYDLAYHQNDLYVKVYAYDSPYAEYFKTRNNNQPVTNTFAQGGDAIAWNVKGDNVIGMFIGSNESDDFKVKTN